MTRKKVNLAYITSDAKRKGTFKKRKNGLIKKIDEISTLCGIEACAIIFDQNDPQPEVWPSPWGVQTVLSRFKRLPELEQSKKMFNQESFLKQRIKKAQEQLKKQRNDNKRKEMTHLMFQCLNAGQIFDHVGMDDLNDISWLIDQNLKQIDRKLNQSQAEEVVQNQAGNVSGGEQGMENIADPMQRQNWPMDFTNNNIGDMVPFENGNNVPFGNNVPHGFCSISADTNSNRSFSISAYSPPIQFFRLTMKMSKKFKSEEELPDCVISYIFSKLSLKDLVKTSVLSKRWLHEWRSRIDLNFDLHNMFDYNTLQELPQNLPVALLKTFQSEFATRMDRFMLKHRGDMIRSLRVDFPLGNQHSDVIDKMIFKGIAKGVERIELLFSYQNNADFEIEPYKFVFELLSLDDSLTYLHLQKCHLVAPINLSGFNNLRTLVLHLVVVKQDLLQGMLSSCIHLVDFTLNDCEFNSDLKIISPKLFNLNIVNCGVEIGREKNIDIIASNLSSIEYSCNGREVHSMNIKADMLSKFSYRGREISQHIGFSGLKNVTTIVFDGLHECISDDIVPHLFSECLQLEDVTFKNCWMICRMKIISPKLRRLSIIDCCYDGMSPYRMSIDALNLSSFEYSGYTRVFSVNAPRLSKVFWNATTREETPFAIHPYESLLYIENLTMIMSTSQVEKLTEVLVEFQNLKNLELFIEGAYDHNLDYFWILDIAMASHHLEKLSVTIENSHMIGLQRKRREYAGFFHNDLKYVELHGCVCTINVIELASHLLRNADSLKKITFSSLDKFYMGAGRWTKGSNVCCWGFKRNFIHEMLKDDVNEHCLLTIV